MNKESRPSYSPEEIRESVEEARREGVEHAFIPVAAIESLIERLEKVERERDEAKKLAEICASEEFLQGRLEARREDDTDLLH